MEEQGQAEGSGVLLPRVYRVKLVTMLLLLPLSAGLAALGGWGSWYFAYPEHSHSEWARQVFLVMSVFLAAGSLYMIVYTLTSRFVLTAETVELSAFLYKRSMRLEDIAGRRVRLNHGTIIVYLFPKQADGSVMKFSPFFRLDENYFRWFNQLPNLDEADRIAALTDIAQEREFGVEEADRLEAWRRARRIARVLNVAGIAAGLWGIFYPHPYEWSLAALAVMPVAALLLVIFSKGMYTLDESMQAGDRIYPSLFLFWTPPAAALALRAVFDINVLDWQLAALYSVMGGMLLALIAQGAPRRKIKYTWAGLAFIFSLWCFGVTLFYNQMFDQQRLATYEPRLIQKFKADFQYRFKLEPWGSLTEPASYMVWDTSWYANAEPGDRICVFPHAGTLRIRWVEVMPCVEYFYLVPLKDSPERPAK
jgi:hypothetical protein